MPNLQAVFVPPSDENIKIWRYMDFSKFVSFVASKSLYFSRSDLLGDPFEGSYPEVNKEARIQFVEEFHEKLIETKASRDWIKPFLEKQSGNNKLLANHMFVNCWHVNECESSAMWNIYAKDNKGIAIQSTYKS